MDDDDLGTTRWFGDSWGAPVNDPRTRVDPPTDLNCISCHMPIRSDDRGLTMPYLDMDIGPTTCAYHRDCFFDEIGVPHD